MIKNPVSWLLSKLEIEEALRIGESLLQTTWRRIDTFMVAITARTIKQETCRISPTGLCYMTKQVPFYDVLPNHPESSKDAPTQYPERFSSELLASPTRLKAFGKVGPERLLCAFAPVQWHEEEKLGSKFEHRYFDHAVRLPLLPYHLL
jgi:hypothetical protein